MQHTPNSAIKAYLDHLYYDVGRQAHNFKVAIAWKDSVTQELRWTKHVDYLSAQSDTAFIDKVNNREILKHELVIDYDPKPLENKRDLYNKANSLMDRAEALGIRAWMYDTGGKGYHIHLLNQSWLLIEDAHKLEKFKLIFLKVMGADLHKAYRSMIALEFAPHWRSGNNKTLIRQINAGEDGDRNGWQQRIINATTN